MPKNIPCLLHCKSKETFQLLQREICRNLVSLDGIFEQLGLIPHLLPPNRQQRKLIWNLMCSKALAAETAFSSHIACGTFENIHNLYAPITMCIWTHHDQTENPPKNLHTHARTRLRNPTYTHTYINTSSSQKKEHYSSGISVLSPLLFW